MRFATRRGCPSVGCGTRLGPVESHRRTGRVLHPGKPAITCAVAWGFVVDLEGHNTNLPHGS